MRFVNGQAYSEGYPASAWGIGGDAGVDDLKRISKLPYINQIWSTLSVRK